MRRALIAVIVASALFGIGAFAADLTVQSEDIASGSNDVVACADDVDVDFATTYDGTSDWDVQQVTLTFYDGAPPTATAECDGFGAAIAVTTDAGTQPAATGEGIVGGTTSGEVTITLSPALKANDIISAAVLVDGKELNVDTPGGGFTP